MRSAIPNRNTRQFDNTPVHVPQNVGPASPKMFVCVESPWYTASETLATDTYGREVAAVALPIINRSVSPSAKIDTPNAETFSNVYVLTRDADGFPETAHVDYSGEYEETSVTKIYCGPLQGRPYRGQIIEAVPHDGHWWMHGSVNPSMFGVVKDIGSPQLVTLTTVAGAELMPSSDSEYSENMDMPVADSVTLAEGVDYQVDDLVIVTWIGAAYYVTWIQCQEVV